MINFIFGIFFGVVILPITDQLVGLILTGIEALKSKLAVSITKSNVTMRQLEMSQQEEHSFAVGFQLPPTEEEDYDE